MPEISGRKEDSMTRIRSKRERERKFVLASEPMI